MLAIRLYSKKKLPYHSDRKYVTSALLFSRIDQPLRILPCTRESTAFRFTRTAPPMTHKPRLPSHGAALVVLFGSRRSFDRTATVRRCEGFVAGASDVGLLGGTSASAPSSRSVRRRALGRLAPGGGTHDFQVCCLAVCALEEHFRTPCLSQIVSQEPGH